MSAIRRGKRTKGRVVYRIPITIQNKGIIAAAASEPMACNDSVINQSESFTTGLIQQLQHAAASKQVVTSPQLYSRLATRALQHESRGRRTVPLHLHNCQKNRAPIYFAPLFNKDEWVATPNSIIQRQPAAALTLEQALADVGLAKDNLSDFSGFPVPQLGASRPTAAESAVEDGMSAKARGKQPAKKEEPTQSSDDSFRIKPHQLLDAVLMWRKSQSWVGASLCSNECGTGKTVIFLLALLVNTCNGYAACKLTGRDTGGDRGANGRTTRSRPLCANRIRIVDVIPSNSATVIFEVTLDVCDSLPANAHPRVWAPGMNSRVLGVFCSLAERESPWSGTQNEDKDAIIHPRQHKHHTTDHARHRHNVARYCLAVASHGGTGVN
ncbi:hypothetical protein QBC46DRAFT_439924 [Diplogelasinospora grovesii]|uniref:SNF2 N-terminal domain-containing protein n=1 Tax=Diplogelasinospora grovesii TaxID=303347 RepID=A0AAN6N7A3_9PEZI|nr:hypothetical protein QBC46DRAFT_439924 [Diplogelasinospora grovesii]